MQGIGDGDEVTHTTKRDHCPAVGGVEQCLRGIVGVGPGKAEDAAAERPHSKRIRAPWRPVGVVRALVRRGELEASCLP